MVFEIKKKITVRVSCRTEARLHPPHHSHAVFLPFMYAVLFTSDHFIVCTDRLSSNCSTQLCFSKLDKIKRKGNVMSGIHKTASKFL